MRSLLNTRYQALLKVSQQTIWQLIGKVITSLSTIIILAVITRHFREEGTGLFTLALTYLAFFTLAIDFGLNAYLMPQLIKEDFENVWRKLFGFRLILSAVLIPVAFLGGFIWPTDNYLFKQLILIGSVMAVLEPAVYVSANAIFQSRLRYDLSVIGWSGASLVTLGLIYSTTKLGLGLQWLMIDYSIGWLFGCLVLLFFIKKFVKYVWPIFDFNFIGDLIKKSWPISATLILNVVYFRLDAFILSFYHPFKDVGIYNLAYQIFQAVLVVPTFIMNGYFPMMLEHVRKRKDKFISSLKLSFTAMALLGFLATVSTQFFSSQIISVVTGKGFSGSAGALKILSFGFPAFFLSALLMWVMVSLKKYKIMALVYLFGLVFNGLANLIFIPTYSYIAASWTTVVSEYLILLLQTAILIRIKT